MACIFEFTTQSVIGQHEQRIVYPPCRRLNTKIAGVVECYGAEAESQFSINRIVERLDKLERTMGSTYPAHPEHVQQLEMLDRQVIEIQRHCEKICRKIQQGDLPFCEKMKLWHERVQVYSKLLRYHEGKTHNVGNLCQLVRKRGIHSPRRLTINQIFWQREAARA